MYRVADGKFVGYWCMVEVAGLMRQLTEEPVAARSLTPSEPFLLTGPRGGTRAPGVPSASGAHMPVGMRDVVTRRGGLDPPRQVGVRFRFNLVDEGPISWDFSSAA